MSCQHNAHDWPSLEFILMNVMFLRDLSGKQINNTTFLKMAENSSKHSLNKNKILDKT